MSVINTSQSIYDENGKKKKEEKYENEAKKKRIIRENGHWEKNSSDRDKVTLYVGNRYFLVLVTCHQSLSVWGK